MYTHTAIYQKLTRTVYTAMWTESACRRRREMWKNNFTEWVSIKIIQMEERLWKENTSKNNIDGASITDIESNLNKAVVIVQRLHILLLYSYNTHTYINTHTPLRKHSDVQTYRRCINHKTLLAMVYWCPNCHDISVLPPPSSSQVKIIGKTPTK